MLFLNVHEHNTTFFIAWPRSYIFINSVSPVLTLSAAIKHKLCAANECIPVKIKRPSRNATKPSRNVHACANEIRQITIYFRYHFHFIFIDDVEKAACHTTERLKPPEIDSPSRWKNGARIDQSRFATHLVPFGVRFKGIRKFDSTGSVINE